VGGGGGWLDSYGSGQRFVAWSWEHSTEILGSRKGRNRLAEDIINVLRRMQLHRVTYMAGIFSNGITIPK
jgi:hypothetical protein